MSGEVFFCHSGNAWLRKIWRKRHSCDFFGSIQAASSMQVIVLWRTLSGLIPIKKAVFCNTNLAYLPCPPPPPIFSEKKEAHLRVEYNTKRNFRWNLCQYVKSAITSVHWLKCRRDQLPRTVVTFFNMCSAFSFICLATFLSWGCLRTWCWEYLNQGGTR